MVKLSDICKKVTNINSDFIGTIDYIDISSIDNKRKSIVSTKKLDFSEAPSRAKQLVFPGDILISNVRPNLNTVAMIIDDKNNTLVASTGYTVIRCNNNVLNRYVFFFCQYSGFVKLLASQATGANYPAVNASIIKNTIIPLPTLEKQHQIANVLDKLQSIITHLRTQLEKLDLLVKARFVEMCNANPSCNLLSEFISKYNAEKCGERDLPVLSITKNDGIVLQSEKFSKRIASIDSSTYKIVPRDKLVQGIHIDERNFDIQDIVDFGIVSPAYKIWSVNDEKCIPKVLAFALRTDKTMEYIKSKFTGSVKRRESISYEDFMNTPIDLPSYDVQTQFADFVKQVDQSKSILQQELDKAQTLFDSLMQEYFG